MIFLEEGSDLKEEFKERFTNLKKDLFEKEIEISFTGKYDKENAIFTIMAGARRKGG